MIQSVKDKIEIEKTAWSITTKLDHVQGQRNIESESDQVTQGDLISLGEIGSWFGQVRYDQKKAWPVKSRLASVESRSG